MKTVDLVLLPTGGDAWRRIAVRGAPAASPRCVLVAPGASVLARTVAPAGTTPAQRRAAALASLAPELAEPVSALACDVGTASGARLAIIAARAQVDAWMKAARDAGLAPDAIVPDFLLLPRPEAGSVHIAAGDDVIVRTAEGGFACQPDLIDVLTRGLTVRHLNFEQAAIQSVRSGVLADIPNLFAPLRSEKRSVDMRFWRPAAGIAAAAMICAAPWVEALRLGAETTTLNARTAEIARTALPAARRIVDPVAQLREAAYPHQHTQDLLNTAAGLLEGLALSPNVKMSGMELGADGVVRARLSTPDLIQLQPLRDHLAATGLRGVETPGEPDSRHLNVEISVSGAT